MVEASIEAAGNAMEYVAVAGKFYFHADGQI